MAEPRQERAHTGGERPIFDRSIPGILADLFSQFTTLIRQEAELARTELSENVSRAVMGAAMVGAAAVLLVPSLVLLMMAGAYGIASFTEWPLWVSALIVGGGFTLIGLIMLLIGVSRLKARALMPDKTISQVKEDAAMARRQMNKDPAVVPTNVRSGDGYERAA